MNKYIRAAICVPFGVIKITWIKLCHPFTTSIPFISLISPFTEITIDHGAKLMIGSLEIGGSQMMVLNLYKAIVMDKIQTHII